MLRLILLTILSTITLLANININNLVSNTSKKTDIYKIYSDHLNIYYNPTLGRYMQSDPIGFDGGVNTFGYVGGNPVVRVDESGEIWDTVADIGFILYDVGSGAYHYTTGDDEAFKTDMSALAADSAAAMVPFATGAGIAVRAGKAFSHTFKADEAVIHFNKHADEIMHAFGKSSYNLKQYIKDANYVIKYGNYVPELNGYVKLIGGKGSAKYAFVGIDRATGKITTFHIKTAKELSKKAPSLGIIK